MKCPSLLLAAALLASCASPDGEKTSSSTGQAPEPLVGGKEYRVMDLPNLEDNVRQDTLLVYTTHALGDGTFVMAAKNKEDGHQGLRLILYRPQPDSSAAVLAVSKPAYDSAVMLPTYFTTGDTADGIIILANYGERESWGQNVFWLKHRQFLDLGWLDVAERTWTDLGDGPVQRRTSIAPHTHVEGAAGQFVFSFATDSVQLYYDLQGGSEVMLASPRIQYRYAAGRMTLWVDGKERLPQQPL